VRIILSIVGLVLVIGGLAAVKGTQIKNLIAAGEQFQKVGPPPEAVGTDVARELAWEGTLTAVGSIAAVRGVQVAAEAPGVVKRIGFESGAVVKAGQVLVELDTSVERAQLATAQSRAELAELTAKRTRVLFSNKVTTQQQLEADEAQLKTALAEIDTLQAQIARKTVRAAFPGKLGIREVNLGQYVSPGVRLTTLDALDSVFVDFALPQQVLSSLAVGMPVRITVEGESGVNGEGKISAIDPGIDEVTRTIRVRASIPNTKGELRPGMFAQVAVVLPKRDAQVGIPATAVVHATYGDSVFVVEPLPTEQAVEGTPANVKIARQQFVKLGEARGDFVAVLDGVKSGQELVSAGAFKLRNGAKIAIDNTIKLDPSQTPSPQNR
jgi:membrane fusion protein, multidrug efflux system